MDALASDSEPAPDLSVIVAAWPDAAGLEDCLAALRSQLDTGTEVIVVHGGSPNGMAERYPAVRWVSDSPGLIPVLWAAGIRAARGEVVAITTSHFLPAPDWVASIRTAHARLESPAIGGAIDTPRGGTTVDWATYFLRYSAYHGHDCEQDVPDVAGDNASYKRAELAAHPEWFTDGFWEQDVHRRLQLAGQRVTFVPAVRVRQARSFGSRRFLAQRFAHGRQYGSNRFARGAVLPRLAGVLASPLIPLILLAKVTRRVVRSRRNFWQFVFALPALACFVAAWSLGEVSGYILPEAGHAESSPAAAVRETPG